MTAHYPQAPTRENALTVVSLITLLRELPQDAAVMVANEDDGCLDYATDVDTTDTGDVIIESLRK